MIEIKNVSFGYGNAVTIHNIDLKINKGDFIAITGENGAGKSTLLRLIRGLLKPNEGKIEIDGNDIAKIKTSSLAAKIGFLFQNPDRQLCKSTIKEELLFTLQYTVKDKEKREQLCKQALIDFGFDGNADPFEMSRGERQKVALSSTLVSEPDILILDEPTTGLDFFECTEMMNRVTELNKNGCTVIMVCHDMEVVLDYAKRTIVMDRGKIIADGDVKDIFYDTEVMKNSAVLPPQIIELETHLGNPFGRIYTVDEMTQAVLSHRGK